MTRRLTIDPAVIDEQRSQGWPDIHPEDYCHICGHANPVWYVDDREVWLAATESWAKETGREGICCPRCFQRMLDRETGERSILRVTVEGLGL